MDFWASEVSVVVDVPSSGIVPKADPAPPFLSLPVTGTEAILLIAAALVLVVLGVVLVWACRWAQA